MKKATKFSAQSKKSEVLNQKQTQSKQLTKTEKIQEIKKEQQKQLQSELKMENEKILPQASQQQMLQLSFTKEIKLESFIAEIHYNFLAKKNTFFLDLSETLHTFFKYKGVVIDFPLYQIEEKMQRSNQEKFIEEIRKSIIRALRCGSTLVFYLGTLTFINFKEFFKTADYFEIDKIFNPDEICKQEFYKKRILKPEEDIDQFGNKGNFLMNKDFRICIIIHDTKLDELEKTLNLPQNLFNFCKIVQ